MTNLRPFNFHDLPFAPNTAQMRVHDGGGRKWVVPITPDASGATGHAGIPDFPANETLINLFFEALGQEGVPAPGFAWYGTQVAIPLAPVSDYWVTPIPAGYPRPLSPNWYQLPVLLTPDVVPPPWTPARLRAITGAIWPTRGPVSFGPREGQPDNIIDTGCEAYSASELALSRTIIREHGYSHVQMGPFIDPGYHEQYPAVDFRNNPDEVLALIESWWAEGFAVMAFIGPDNWTTAQMATLEPIFAQPRWQAAMRQIVPYGWEPSKDTSNADFVARFEWARRVFPNALQYIHLAADFDAPGNNTDFTPGQPGYIGYAEAWARVTPYLTGFLVQNGPYGVSPTQDPTLAANFGNQFRADVRGTLRDRFVNGYAGWPTTCATGEPLDLIAAEQTSYYAYWNNLPEDISREWGALAMANGAHGYFDGGRT